MKKIFAILMCLFSISSAEAYPHDYRSYVPHGGYHEHRNYYPVYRYPPPIHHMHMYPHYVPYPAYRMPPEPHYFSNGYWPSGNPMIYLNGQLMPDGYNPRSSTYVH